MANVDAVALAQLAQSVGLLTEAQILEAWEELGERGGDAEPLIRFLERKGYLTPWQTQKLLKQDRDGYFLGGYRLLYRIATGSFGRVYRADDPHTGRVVALKILKRRWSEKRHNVELFEREGKVGQTLNHPGVVETLGVNQDPVTGQYFIVMEFIEGGNLRDFLQIRKKLDPAEALRILEDVTAGLAYANSKGVTHRDIKPSNILISSEGTAKLVDFGLAKIYSAYSSSNNSEEQIERTVDYAGLEEATSVQPGDVRSDIFFLGCILYEMLTGRPPLPPTKDRHARMHRHRFENIEPIRPEEVGGPPSVLRLVETMLSLEPLHRYQTPSQLIEAIRAVRRELDGKTAGAPAGPRSVFVVEKDERLQDALRDKFKELGYRVLLAADPIRALDRFRQQPFDALVIDVGTTGKDGQLVFERIMSEADKHNLTCAGIAIFSEDQADWAGEMTSRPRTAPLVRPVTLKQVYRQLQTLCPCQES
jgi:eukaryotic-like serine/threonine-protein kinase